MELNNLCLGCMYDKGEAINICPICGYQQGAKPESAFFLMPGTVLNDKYLIGKALGYGGFGVTYLAWDINLDIKLAIKEYFPQDLASRADNNPDITIYSGDSKEQFEYGLEKFLDEARLLAKFIDNPCIVSVRDFFKENGTAYMVMSYLEGMNLKDFVKQKGSRIPVDTALNILMPVMDALRQVHTKDILHRDISPDNIMITVDGNVKLIDFGAARQSILDKGKGLSVILKPGFAPEEQYRTKGIQGPWTDIYALAATMYRCITGTIPPDSLERMQNDTLLMPSGMGINISPNVEQALLKALAVKASDRFQKIEDFQSALMDSSYKSDIDYSYVDSNYTNNQSFQQNSVNQPQSFMQQNSFRPSQAPMEQNNSFRPSQAPMEQNNSFTPSQAPMQQNSFRPLQAPMQQNSFRQANAPEQQSNYSSAYSSIQQNNYSQPNSYTQHSPSQQYYSQNMQPQKHSGKLAALVISISIAAIALVLLVVMLLKDTTVPPVATNDSNTSTAVDSSHEDSSDAQKNNTDEQSSHNADNQNNQQEENINQPDNETSFISAEGFTMTTDVDNNNRPLDEVFDYYQNTSQFIVAGTINNAPANTKVTFNWYYLDANQLFSSSDLNIDGTQNVLSYVTRGEDLFPVGRYRVEVNINDVANPIVALDFSVKQMSGDYSERDYLLPQSYNNYINENDLINMSAWEVRLARNEIYARHGYVFKTTEIQEYFKSKNWYMPNPSYKGGGLNQYESYNIEFIKAYEESVFN